MEKLSRYLIVPLMEKLLSEGTIHEYEIDTEAVHTEAPGAFWVFYIASNAESLDKVNAALRDTLEGKSAGWPCLSFGGGHGRAPRLSAAQNATYK